MIPANKKKSNNSKGGSRSLKDDQVEVLYTILLHNSILLANALQTNPALRTVLMKRFDFSNIPSSDYLVALHRNSLEQFMGHVVQMKQLIYSESFFIEVILALFKDFGYALPTSTENEAFQTFINTNHLTGKLPWKDTIGLFSDDRKKNAANCKELFSSFKSILHEANNQE